MLIGINDFMIYDYFYVNFDQEQSTVTLIQRKRARVWTLLMRCLRAQCEIGVTLTARSHASSAVGRLVHAFHIFKGAAKRTSTCADG